MKKNNFSFFEIKKYLDKKGFIVRKKINEKNSNNIGAIARTLLSSLIIISFFFVTPLVIDLTKKEIILSKDYENNSKNKLENLLENQDQKYDSVVDNKFLFEDILIFDELPNDTVRLSAATIEEIFKSTNYNLEDVRKNKLVKPISLTLLPNEIIKIENSKKRKDLFKNTKEEKNWLNSKFKQYGVINKDLPTLKIRMDEVPTSMAIAQAAKETGWGTSRFAQEGNALFGQWTWSGEGIKPSEADNDSTHKVMKFKVLQASVRAYQRNLNTHSSYKDFRSARAELRDEGKKLDSIILSEHLDKYAETGKEYVRVLQQIIKQNNLADFDDAKLLPSSIDLESLI